MYKVEALVKIVLNLERYYAYDPSRVVQPPLDLSRYITYSSDFGASEVLIRGSLAFYGINPKHIHGV